jgi:hypothetical protein
VFSIRKSPYTHLVNAAPSAVAASPRALLENSRKLKRSDPEEGISHSLHYEIALAPISTADNSTSTCTRGRKKGSAHTQR